MRSLHGVLHGSMDKVSWSPGNFVRLTSKRWACRKFRENVIFLKFYIFIYLLFVNPTIQNEGHIPWQTNSTKWFSQSDRVWDMLYCTRSSPLFPPPKYAMVPQHGPFSLHTMLEGPWLHKMAFSTPMIRPLDESQGSSLLQGRGSWLLCEVALSVPCCHD